MNYITVFITCSSSHEADKITKAILRARLAACGNIIKGVSSTYWWKGKIEKANEVLLIMKTKKVNLNTIIKRVKELHSYEVPEIIALPIIGGSKDYLNWIEESTSKRN